MPRPPHRYTYQGVQGTLTELVDRFSDNPLSVVRLRLWRGWSLAEALTIPCGDHDTQGRATRNGRHRFGELEGSVFFLAARLGYVDPHTAVSRYGRGWSLKRAITEPANPVGRPRKS